MYGRNLGEIIINIAILALFIFLLVILFGPLFYLAIILLIGYIIYVIIQNIRRKVAESKQPEFDEQGRRITEVSVLEITDAEEIKSKPEEKQKQERK